MSRDKEVDTNNQKPIARVHDLIVSTMGKRIISGHYESEVSLGNETELGKNFDASRTATREALKMLSAKGLIESKPKIGTVVRGRDHWNMLDPMVLKWCLEDSHMAEKTMAEIYEMRLAVEPNCAVLAAKNRTAADKLSMRQALRGMAHYVGASDKVAADLAFHTAILKATKNSLFLTLGGLISVGLEHIFHSSLEATAEEDDRWIERHKLVFDAIESGNGKKAGAQMEKLLLEARDIQNDRLPMVTAKAVL